MSSRLDSALAQRGLARSRSHAATLIADGRVRIDGVPAVKAAVKVSDGQDLEVEGGDHYVSRGAHKLIAALDGFGIGVEHRVALDMGASTGGFTQVLRERGADPVIAVDVGHGQLDAAVAADRGVRAVEGFNVRHMTRRRLAEASGVEDPPGVITGDLSFISLRYVLPAVAELVAESAADVVLLIKPQFEVGRTGVREGIVVEPALRASAIRDVLEEAGRLGLGTLGVLPSPVDGTHGNREALVHLSPGRGTPPGDWEDAIVHAAGQTLSP